MDTVKPNSRFLFETQIAEEIDIAKSIGKIDKSVNESSKLQLANHHIIVSFEEAPEDPEFKRSTILVGREVLGYDTSVFSAHKFIDLQKKDVKHIPIELHSDWADVFSAAEGHVFNLKHWRLLIKDDFSEAFIEI